MSESSNPNEAAAALRQAIGLMRKHGITRDQVLKPDIQESSAQSRRKSTPYWLIALSNLVAEAFLCRVYIARQQDTPEFVFIGHDVAPQIASYTFTVLSRVLIRARFKYMAALSADDSQNLGKRELHRRGNVFAQAWLYRVTQTVRAFATSPQSNAAIDKYIHDNYGETGDFELDPANSKPDDYDTIVTGMRAAKHVSLYKPVHKAAQTEQLEELV